MYDEIANLYHLIYPDWEAAIPAQGKTLDRLIGRLVDDGGSVLDVSCGIGTQALGLAALGHDVTASDLSSGAIGRARREAEQRDLAIEFSVADMRDCLAHHGSGYDVVLSADNSLPHLTGDDVESAVRGFLGCLRPGGAVIIGIRDYRSDEDRTSPQVWPYGFREHTDGRYYIFQTRDWDGDSYEVGMYFVREETEGEPAKVVSGRSTYHALQVDDLMALLVDVGFERVERVDGASHQPVITAIRPED